ncbi:MAG: ribonuclease HII [Clostridiales bacterium]|nr:ribonuclease HII [Clostridiales bacterium]
MAETREERQARIIKQYKDMSTLELDCARQGFIHIAGVDEAGRGPLAGPVYAACVIIDPRKPLFGVNDSKKLSEKCREALYDIIIEKAASYGIGYSDNEIINEHGIMYALNRAMQLALRNCKIQPDMVLIDGNVAFNIASKVEPIVNGDARSVSIAAASILAKVSRDRVMKEYDKLYPEYNFASNKGYGTADHIEAIKKYGLCPIHREVFCRTALTPKPQKK